MTIDIRDCRFFSPSNSHHDFLESAPICWSSPPRKKPDNLRIVPIDPIPRESEATNGGRWRAGRKDRWLGGWKHKTIFARRSLIVAGPKHGEGECARVYVCVCARELASPFLPFSNLSSLLLVSSRLASPRLASETAIFARPLAPMEHNGRSASVHAARAHTLAATCAHACAHSFDLPSNWCRRETAHTHRVNLPPPPPLSLSPSLHDGGLSISRPPRLYKSLLVRPTRENTRKYVFPPLKYRNDTSALLLVNSVVLRCY